MFKKQSESVKNQNVKAIYFYITNCVMKKNIEMSKIRFELTTSRT